MKVLFANLPHIKILNGMLHTGPNAGSRWPWTAPGSDFSLYAPFPFYLAYAMQYAKSHGVECYFYDGVALRHSDIEMSKSMISSAQFDIIVYDVSTPTFSIANDFAKWAKETMNCRNVFCGPHMKAYSQECLALPHIDNVVVGEYDIPVLDICLKLDQSKKLYSFEHLKNINTLPNGDNFLPFRPLEYLGNYYDPSMRTAPIQLTMSTSRGCPFKCTYCQWPNVINNGKYRARTAEYVVDELKQMKTTLGPSLRSVFFDDDTWNLGKSRIEQICIGLKDLGVPWSMMGRIDTSEKELYKTMVDSGCVGMRFGVETFNQEVSNNVKKQLNVTVAYDNLRYLVTTFSNMEFHFTTMKNLPGEPAGSWERDQKMLKELQAIGAKRGNVVHWQISNCIPFPGTELWQELVDAGHGAAMKDFSLYDAIDSRLEQAVGWLGDNYKPKFSEYSKLDGAPTNFPTS